MSQCTVLCIDNVGARSLHILYLGRNWVKLVCGHYSHQRPANFNFLSFTLCRCRSLVPIDMLPLLPPLSALLTVRTANMLVRTLLCVLVSVCVHVHEFVSVAQLRSLPILVFTNRISSHRLAHAL